MKMNMNMNGEGEYVAEVIESRTTDFVAQCRELHHSPPFGALVKAVSKPVVFAFIHDISTHSIEPQRRPIAYGKTEEELREEQPQIFELLKTDFRSVVVGYEQEGQIYQMLPPQPPRIHSFVYTCTKEEVMQFTDRMDFLRTLLTFTKGVGDELIIAACRTAVSAHGGDANYLVLLGKELSRLIRADYERLSALLRRIAIL